MERNFMQLLRALWAAGKFVCLGLDTGFEQIRSYAESGGVTDTIFKFNRQIIDATHDIVCAYKPNIAFYEEFGVEALIGLQRTLDYLRATYPEVVIILDCKRGDIGNTNNGYVASAFNQYGADAVTVNPYLGSEALAPFLRRSDKGIIVLCRTSNDGAGEFQDLPILYTRTELAELCEGLVRTTVIEGFCDSLPFYQHVGLRVANHWNVNGNCLLVVGATYPEELAKVRLAGTP